MLVLHCGICLWSWNKYHTWPKSQSSWRGTQGWLEGGRPETTLAWDAICATKWLPLLFTLHVWGVSTVTNASTQFRDEDQRSSSELLNCLQGRTMMEFRASLPWSLISAKLPTSGKGRPGKRGWSSGSRQVSGARSPGYESWASTPKRGSWAELLSCGLFPCPLRRNEENAHIEGCSEGSVSSPWIPGTSVQHF